MKTKNLKTPIMLLLGMIFFANVVSAQSLSASSTTLTKPSGSATVTSTITRSSGDWNGSNDYTWSVSPSTGASLNGTPVAGQPGVYTYGTGSSNSTLTLTFTSSAALGVYTVKVSRGTDTRYVYINLVGGTTGTTNFWAAYGGAGSNSEVQNFSILSGIYTSGPSSLFTVGQDFYALGRSPYPTPADGYYYYIPAVSGNDGSFTLYGRNGDGSGTNTIIGSLDLNGTSTTDLGFVRLALDKNSVAWIMAGNGTNLYLAKVVTNGLAQVTPELVDDQVTIVNGNASTFASGDLCLDGYGNMYVLANNNGTTELYIGQENGTNTTITKKWDVKNAAGNAFAGSVNGNAFDQFGGMYFTTSGNSSSSGIANGIYYLDPSTIQSTPVGNTVNARLVYAGDGYTDLGTNVFPTYTALPVVFEETKGMIKGNELLINWTTSSENNNDRFDIEVSKDGKNFVKAGTVKSKSNNGKSDKALHYNFSIKYNDAKSLLSLSVFAIAFILLAFNRKNKLLVMLVLFAGTSVVGTSCKKAATDQIDINNENKIFVRIVQIDKDGKSESSKIFTAYKAD